MGRMDEWEGWENGRSLKVTTQAKNKINNYFETQAR